MYVHRVYAKNGCECVYIYIWYMIYAVCLYKSTFMALHLLNLGFDGYASDTDIFFNFVFVAVIKMRNQDNFTTIIPQEKVLLLEFSSH